MAQVSLILLDDVENLGLAGDEVNVAPGYARNYLLPRGLAAKATPGILRLVESRKAQIAARRAQELADAKALAEKLATVEISIAMQATEDNQLFGSVTARMIADELAAQGYKIEHSRIRLDPPIKLLGSYEIDVKLHAEVTAKVKVWVVRG
jgi:large subunit ribosomal protein L9